MHVRGEQGVERCADRDKLGGEVSVAAGDGVDFVSSDQLAAAASDAGIDDSSADAIVDDYEQAQLRALKTGLLATGVLALLSLMSTRYLPATAPGREDGEPSAATAPAAA